MYSTRLFVGFMGSDDVVLDSKFYSVYDDSARDPPITLRLILN